jgi:hypothetical protein
MNQVGAAHAEWSLKETIAQLKYGQLSGEVNLALPHNGLIVPSLAVRNVCCTLLGARRSAESIATDEQALRDGEHALWPLPIADRYVRGNDLVAAYQAVDHWPYSPQLYWHTGLLDAVHGVIASLSLFVSVQTQLLDTHPQITVVSQAPGQEMLRAVIREDGHALAQPVKSDAYESPAGEMCCMIHRLAGAPVSYIELVTSSDFSAVRGLVSDGSEPGNFSEWRLFSEFLEKGVIRKACVHGALVPQKDDVELAIECCRVAQKCPLPLTT